MRGASSVCLHALMQTDIRAWAWFPAGSRWTRTLSRWLLAEEKKKICRPKQVEKNIIDFSPRLLFILPSFLSVHCICFSGRKILASEYFGGSLWLCGKGMPLIVATKELRDMSPSVFATDLDSWGGGRMEECVLSVGNCLRALRFSWTLWNRDSLISFPRPLFFSSRPQKKKKNMNQWRRLSRARPPFVG